MMKKIKMDTRLQEHTAAFITSIADSRPDLNRSRAIELVCNIMQKLHGSLDDILLYYDTVGIFDGRKNNE